MGESEAHQQQRAEAGDPATSAQRLEALSADPALRIVVAGNPAAPGPLLEHLATDQDEQVREAVASNPNTPWTTLEALAWEFPHEFLHNSVGSLHLMAHPEKISTDDGFWDALLREASIPAVWWNWLLSHPALNAGQTIRLHVQYSGEALSFSHRFQEVSEQTLLTLAVLLTTITAQNIPLPAHSFTSQAAAASKQIIGELLLPLARNPDTKVRQLIAMYPQTPGDVLQILIQDHENDVRRLAAGNEHMPIEVLQTLARDKVEDVRGAVAGNEQTPLPILQALARDKALCVRRAAASKKRMPIEVLQTLAQDQVHRVRGAVAGKKQTPIEVLQALARDEHWDVREAVASKKQTPIEVLQFVVQDEEKWMSVPSHRLMALHESQVVNKAKSSQILRRRVINQREE